MHRTAPAAPQPQRSSCSCFHARSQQRNLFVAKATAYLLPFSVFLWARISTLPPYNSFFIQLHTAPYNSFFTQPRCSNSFASMKQQACPSLPPTHASVSDSTEPLFPAVDKCPRLCLQFFSITVSLGLHYTLS